MRRVPVNPEPERERKPGEGFGRAVRITRGPEIRALFRRGKRSRTAHLDVYDSASPASHPRVGIVVPKHGRKIVQRNRVKRRLREILRREILPKLEEKGLAADVLVRARREAYEAEFAELRQELLDWLEGRCSQSSFCS